MRSGKVMQISPFFWSIKALMLTQKRSFFGYAPLHSATSVDIMRLLIEKGARVDEAIRGMGDYKGYTPLSMAAFKGKPELVKYLLDKGADADTAVMALNNCSKRVQGEKGKMWLVQGNEQGIKLLEKVIGDIKAKMVEERRILEEKRKTEELKAIVAAIEGAKTQKESKSPSVQSDIDKPTFAIAERIFGDNDLAVIIGIEGYQSLPKSDYSYDDAKLMAEYVKALGFKSRNIELLTDEKATKSSIEKSLEAWLKNKAKADSKVFVYYSGHGAPDPSTGDAYLVPYDGDPNYLNVTGYPLKRLYDNLGKLQVAEVTVVLDSCFSGAGGRSVLAKGARPLVMMTTSSVLPSNIAVLSATQGSQISTSSPEKGHGVFTYYFLKALKDGKKNILEIYSYIKPLVEDEAKQLNVQQSPSISPDVEKVKGRFGLRK